MLLAQIGGVAQKVVPLVNGLAAWVGEEADLQAQTGGRDHPGMR